VVIRKLDANDKQNYGDTLIYVAADSKTPRTVLSTTMCEEKKALKERLRAIMAHKKATKTALVLSAILILALAGCAALLGAGSGENDLVEMEAIETDLGDGSFAVEIKWAGRTYSGFSYAGFMGDYRLGDVPASAHGKQIGYTTYITPDNGHVNVGYKIYEFKGYSPEEYLVVRDNVIMGGWSLYKADDFNGLNIATLAALRTPYVGDNGAVGKIVDALPPLGAKHTQRFFSVGDDYGTGYAPNTLTVYYEQEGHTNEDYAITPKNAILLFALIDNLEEVSVAIRRTPSGAELDKSGYTDRVTYNRTDIADYLTLAALTWSDFHDNWDAAAERAFALIGAPELYVPRVVIYEHNTDNTGFNPFVDSNSIDGFARIPFNSDGRIPLNETVTVVAASPAGTVKTVILYAEAGTEQNGKILREANTADPLVEPRYALGDFPVAEWYPDSFLGHIWAVTTDANGVEHTSEILNVIYEPNGGVYQRNPLSSGNVELYQSYIRTYAESRFIQIFSPYYDALRFAMSNYKEHIDGDTLTATFSYTMTHRNYYKDPDTVPYIREAKESGSTYYQTYYDEYNADKEGNFDLQFTAKIATDGTPDMNTAVILGNTAPVGEPVYNAPIEGYVLSGAAPAKGESEYTDIIGYISNFDGQTFEFDAIEWLTDVNDGERLAELGLNETNTPSLNNGFAIYNPDDAKQPIWLASDAVFQILEGGAPKTVGIDEFTANLNKYEPDLSTPYRVKAAYGKSPSDVTRYIATEIIEQYLP
jgi:hypothetical protein